MRLLSFPVSYRGQHRPNRTHPFRNTPSLHVNQFEAEAPINLFMNPLKAQRFFIADTPRFCMRNKSKVAQKEHALLIDRFSLDALQFANQKRSISMSEIHRESRSTHCATIVKLHLIGLMGRSNLAVFLQTCNRIQERRMPPG